ncbi:MAG: protein translocase subunit SecD [Verrucomicrobiaceae bacterium]|nr:MAG: protein translocase subunit SecD [Verrucomicrobiaceae bacterium]
MLAITSFFEDPLTVFVTGLILMILFFWYFATEIERRKRNVGTVLLFGVCALCILACIPLKERLKGGIDIIGGSSFSLRIQEREGDDGMKMPITKEQVEQAILVIEKRLNSMGTAEPLIARQGTDGILVQMPGVEPEESARIRATLEKVAKLELREVSPRNDEAGPNGKSLAQRVQDGDEIVPGYRAYPLKGKDEDGNEYTRPILLNRRMALGGSDIANAVPSPQQADAVAITLNGGGTDKMIALTKNMRPQQDRIAIVLDGEVISAPVVNQVPLGKNFIIEGLREPGEVQSLANSLMNPLENPLVVDEERTVSPTLGAAVVQQGIWAGLIGLSITCVFVLFYYRLAGIVALIGLAVNGIILFGVMAMFGFTFSLPGIAGMILTIGMAVDANVLIYERLREEMAAGKSLKNAIAASYEKAFSAIFDSNITSLITAIILFWMGSGTIKGFAVTLTIGIVASMFSALLVTRVLFRWGIDLNLLKKLSFFNLFKATNFDFLGKRRSCAIASLFLVLLSFAAFGIRKEKAFGIDFTGGTLVQFQLGKEVKIPLEDVEKALKTLTLSKAAYPQEQGNPVSGTLLTIRCDTRDAAAITNKLREAIPALGELKTATNQEGGHDYVIDSSKEEVSALIGGTFLRDSLIALTLGLIGILIYITVRFEFAFALGGFIAILHDVIISIGIVVLLGGELSLIHVGAILTIAGYSINDTIVIFDRIRESLLIRTGSIKAIMNEAINITLSRTVLTSSTTIITVAILSLFGGSSLRDFSIMILIGLVVGTYSSIFVASPVVLWWSRRKGGDLREDVLATEIKAETAAAAP